MIVGYSFDLKSNAILPQKVPNPAAGKDHFFRAWRLKGSPLDPVAMRAVDPTTLEPDPVDEDAEG